MQVKGQLLGIFCVQKCWNNAKMNICHRVQRWSDRIIWKSRLTAQRNLQRKTLWRAYWPLGCCALLSFSSAKSKESSKELSSCCLWPCTGCLIQTEVCISADHIQGLHSDTLHWILSLLRNERQKGKTPWKSRKTNKKKKFTQRKERQKEICLHYE